MSYTNLLFIIACRIYEFSP